MTALDDLIVVQEHDTAADQIRHRRATLPQRLALETLQVELVATERVLAEVGGQHDALVRNEQRLDDEASGHESKAAEMEKRLYSGSVTAPKELQSMQAEVEQYRRLRDQLEDGELELMEQREKIDAELARAERLHAELSARRNSLEQEAAAAEAELDAGLAASIAARVAAAAAIPAAVLDVYEDRRAKAKGVGVARLVGLTCQGCHLSVPAVEADSLRHGPPDALGFCDNCGAILVV